MTPSRTLGTVLFGFVVLVAGITWHEFSIGLQGYTPGTPGAALAQWKLKTVSHDVRFLHLTVPHLGETIPVPLENFPRASVSLDRLIPGPIGRLVGIQRSYKITELVKSCPTTSRRETLPLFGGRDSCWSLMSVTGPFGGLIASPDDHSVEIPFTDAPQGAIILDDDGQEPLIVP